MITKTSLFLITHVNPFKKILMLPKVVWHIMGKEQSKRGVAIVLCVLLWVEGSLPLHPCHTHTTAATPLPFLPKKLPSSDRSFCFLLKKRTFRSSNITILHKKSSNKKIKVNFTCLTSLFLITLNNTLQKWQKCYPKLKMAPLFGMIQRARKIQKVGGVMLKCW